MTAAISNHGFLNHYLRMIIIWAMHVPYIALKTVSRCFEQFFEKRHGSGSEFFNCFRVEVSRDGADEPGELVAVAHKVIFVDVNVAQLEEGNPG